MTVPLSPEDRERCERCQKSEPEVTLSVCCSSHGKTLCHRDYRLTHFVEICGCRRCEAESLPRIYPPKPLSPEDLAPIPAEDVVEYTNRDLSVTVPVALLRKAHRWLVGEPFDPESPEADDYFATVRGLDQILFPREGETVPTKAKKRTWFWAECDQCKPLWRSTAVQDRARAQGAADAHKHPAVVVNPADG